MEILADPQLDGAAIWGSRQQEQLVASAAHRERSCWAAAASVNRLLGRPAGLREGPIPRYRSRRNSHADVHGDVGLSPYPVVNFGSRNGGTHALSSLRKNRWAATALRRDWTRTSSTLPCWSTARLRYRSLPLIPTNTSSRCHLSPGRGRRRRSWLA